MLDVQPPVAKVLLCGLNARKAGPLAQGFSTRGAVATLAFDAAQAAALLDEESFDLVLCSRDLADHDGLDLFVRLESAFAPLVILGEPTNGKASELDEAADVAIPHDATVGEIVATGTALLQKHVTARRHAVLHFAGFALDVDRRTAHFNGEPLFLTKFQFRILVALVSRRGRVVSRAELEQVVFGSLTVDDGERVAAHIRRLRKKIEPDPSSPVVLLTVRSEGYRIAERPTSGQGRRSGASVW